MTYRTFKRQFTDNNKYDEFEKVPYMDALAHVVEEYVYSDKLDMSWVSFDMKNEIRMFDFMTLAVYFINESYQEYGKTTIMGFVEDLKTQYMGRNNTHVEYPEGNLFVTDASYELIMVLLWTTYIYASARYEWGKNEMWADTASMVYGVMVAESELKMDVFPQTSLSKNADSARKMMLTYMLRKEVRNGLKKEVAKEEPAEDSSNLQARIAELEAELKKTKEENVQLKEQTKNSDDFLLEPMDEVQELNLHQKIVFFNTVTSVMLDKRYTKLGNYASFVASMCNEKTSTIGPMLSRIAKATHPDAEKTDSNQRLKSILNVAAQSVSDMLAQTLTDATKNDDKQVINKIRNHLMLNYPSPEDE